MRLIMDHIDDAALLALHRESTALCVAAARGDVASWVRNARIVRHEEIVRQLRKRGFLERDGTMVR